MFDFFLIFNTHLNCTNHKEKYLRLKKLYCICIVYETSYVLFIYFYWKDMPRTFSPLGGLMCSNNKKSLSLPMPYTSSPPPTPPPPFLLKFIVLLVGSIYGIQLEVCGRAFLRKQLTMTVLAEELRRWCFAEFKMRCFVCGGFHHWGCTRKSWTTLPPNSLD